MNDADFSRMFGVNAKIFRLMLKILTKAEEEKYKDGGRPGKLTIRQKLELTLQYLYEYRTFFILGKSFGISESSAQRIVIFVENTLIKSGKFSLPNRQKVLQEKKSRKIEIDSTEIKIERPKSSQRKFIRVRKSRIRLKPR